MKESISYTFLLNIVIVFIFLCFAIIMGVFSYYKAFRANSIIVNAIEKYEGYNCASKAEINKKLEGIGYNVPFTPTCKKDEKDCVVDSINKYKIVPYNLDGPTGGAKGNYYVHYNTGSVYEVTNGDQTHYYRYAVTTYMYVDIPVINQLIRLSFVSKTNTMYEFRDLMRYSYAGFYDEKSKINKSVMQDAVDIQKEYVLNATGGQTDNRIRSVNDKEYDARKRAKYDVNNDGLVDAVDVSQTTAIEKLFANYGTCRMIKSYDNY